MEHMQNKSTPLKDAKIHDTLEALFALTLGWPALPFLSLRRRLLIFLIVLIVVFLLVFGLLALATLLRRSLAFLGRLHILVLLQIQLFLLGLFRSWINKGLVITLLNSFLQIGLFFGRFGWGGDGTSLDEGQRVAQCVLLASKIRLHLRRDLDEFLVLWTYTQLRDVVKVVFGQVVAIHKLNDSLDSLGRAIDLKSFD